MSGKKIALIFLVVLALIQPALIVSTLESSSGLLTISAEPVSTKPFRDEWRDYKIRYALVYALAFGIILVGK